MEKLIVEMLYNLYVSLYDEELDYNTVDNFYGYIGYELESEKLLQELNVNSTSQLQELLLKGVK